MEVSKLKNGMVLIVDKRKTDSVSIQVLVKTGSNNENERINGISHFIEHMLFEGTPKRKDAKIISGEIEKLGGELNAYTSNERTCFYVKVPKKNFLAGLDIISDIIQNPLFDKKKLEKERKIILKEINLHKDEPRFHQWVLFQRALFSKIGARYPTAGSIKSVSGLNREDILAYYKKYYVPNNMVISVVGDVSSAKEQVISYFGKFKPRKLSFCKQEKEPEQLTKIVKKEKRRIFNSYMVLGYKTVSRLSYDSYVLDVIKSILGRGQSGRINDEIRNKRGLAYEVGVYHEPAIGYGFFAVYLNTPKKNIAKVISIISSEFEKLKNLKSSELSEAKGYISGKFILDNEDTHDRADELAFWAFVSDAKLYSSYLKKIEQVSVADVISVAKKYLTKNYTLAVIEQR